MGQNPTEIMKKQKVMNISKQLAYEYLVDRLASPQIPVKLVWISKLNLIVLLLIFMENTVYSIYLLGK